LFLVFKEFDSLHFKILLQTLKTASVISYFHPKLIVAQIFNTKSKSSFYETKK